MNRVVCFAHYDKNNRIEDYVVFYLKELKKISQKIIFVSDSDIAENELNKIKSVVDFSIVGKHGEYDFGSYKRGFLYAKEQGFLKDAEELICANDSCYGPLFPFEEMFSQMSPMQLDFWGASMNYHGFTLENGKKKDSIVPHVQSFFIVFKKQVFNSDVFNTFVKSITKKEKKAEIILEYEIGLTKLLEKNGFNWDVYCELSKNKDVSNAPFHEYKKIIKNERFPLLKRSFVLLKDYKINYPCNISKLVKNNTNYNFELIKKDIRRNQLKLGKVMHFLGISKQIIRRSIIKIHTRDLEIYLFGKRIDLTQKEG